MRSIRIEWLSIRGISLLPLLVLVACSTPRPVFRPDQPFASDNDQKTIDEVSGRDPSLIWQSIDRTFFLQAEQALDLRRGFGTFWGTGHQAVNVNRFDEVPNSSWYTNRHGFYRMSPDQLTRGVAVTDGPDQSRPWKVFRPKVGGKTPGFWIVDARGDEYILKFDPPGNPEMATAAGAMGARYFHACGYNVPQETVVYWYPEQLEIREGASIKDAAGAKRPLVQADLDSILAQVEREPDGRIRSLASLSLGTFGKIKGPFSYDGTRPDDPNDWCPHEHRRELRALYVIGSFINHYDLKDQNSMDIFVEREAGKGYLKHFLLDFGSTFGSDGQYAKNMRKGYANMFDLKDVLVSIFTLGLNRWYWEDGKPTPYPELGYFESEVFDPGRFDPIVPNPAFENMTNRDAYWGAKVVMAWRDEDLRALINAGEYSRPEVADYLFDRLKERRDKIGRHWFARVNPLDWFAVSTGSFGLKIDFEDLWNFYSLQPGSKADYRYAIRYRGRTIVDGPLEGTQVWLSADDLATLRNAFEPGDGDEHNLYQVDIKTRRDNGAWSKPVRLWLWYHEDRSEFEYVGLEHVD